MLNELITLLFGFGIAPAFDPLTIASLAMSLGGGVASMVGSANANKKRQTALDGQVADSNAFFNKEYYTDELNRTENQSMLRTLTDRLKDQNKQAQGTAAITGATPEMVVAQQGNANKAYADVVNRIAGNASMRKDAVMRGWRADKRQLYGMQDNLDQGRAATWANLGANAAGLGANAIGTMGAPKVAGAVGVGGIAPAIGDGSKSLFDTAAQTFLT